MAADNYDLVILGGGVAGLNLTSAAAQLGLKVLLVEKSSKLGGDCLHFGCVPSKTLIASAKVAHQVREAARFGLDATLLPVDAARVMGRVRNVIEGIQVHDSPERLISLGAEVEVSTSARFVGRDQLAINGRTVRAARFVIATGSHPAVPPINGLREAGFLTNETVFAIAHLPPRLIVLGGGAIGIELAQAFARLGSRVTVVEMLERIIPPADPELSERLKKYLVDEGLTILTATKAISVALADGIRRLTIESSDGRKDLEAEQILVAVGRQPNLDGLELGAAGIEFSNKGIEVDARLRTTNKHVYACGDIAGPYLFTHMAEYQAGVVVRNAIFRLPAKVNYRVVPWTVFTDPELAHVGISEAEAREQNRKFEVLRFEFAEIDRARAEGETAGVAKVIAVGNRIAGATILGPGAGELIHEFVLAIGARLKLSDISQAIHVYPTLAQIARRAVNTHYTPILFSPRTRRLVRWLQHLPL